MSEAKTKLDQTAATMHADGTIIVAEVHSYLTELKSKIMSKLLKVRTFILEVEMMAESAAMVASHPMSVVHHMLPTQIVGA